MGPEFTEKFYVFFTNLISLFNAVFLMLRISLLFSFMSSILSAVERQARKRSSNSIASAGPAIFVEPMLLLTWMVLFLMMASPKKVFTPEFPKKL